MVLVSVVVPTYRRPALLRQALDGLAAQTHDELEVLVCDNDADEAVGALVGEYGPRFSWHPRTVNLGMLRSVTAGVLASRGAYVTLHDDDDVLDPRAVELLLAPLLAAPASSLSFGDAAYMDAEGGPLRPDRVPPDPRRGLQPGLQADPVGLVVRRAVSTFPTLFRRDAVDWPAVPDDVAMAYDVHMPLEAAHAGSFQYVARPLGRIRLHEGQNTSQHLLGQQQAALASLLLARERAGRREPAIERETRIKTLAVYRLLLDAGDVAGARAFARGVVTDRPGPLSFALALLDRLPSRARARVVATAERRRRARA